MCQTAGVDLPDFVEIERTPKLRSPRLVAAFRGWNDAGASASLAAGYLRAATNAERFAVIDSEPFVDYQQTRPHVQLADGYVRNVEWPVTELFADEDSDLVLVLGSEPNFRWRAYTDAVCSIASSLHVELVVTLGALLADTPHTRPIPVSGTATEPEITDRLKLEQSNYEGPTGIVGVFADAATQADLPSVSFWAAVPHYVAQPPCPKATLALLGQVEDLLEVSIPLSDLPEEARAWERGVDELSEEDEEIGDYVRALEETRDTADLPEASGEAIAREFERYLKRRETGSD